MPIIVSICIKVTMTFKWVYRFGRQLVLENASSSVEFLWDPIQGVLQCVAMFRTLLRKQQTEIYFSPPERFMDTTDVTQPELYIDYTVIKLSVFFVVLL